MLTIPNFADKLYDAQRTKRSLLCAGLDPQLKCIPPQIINETVRCCGKSFEAVGNIFTDFNCQLIDALCDIVCCVKIQMAHYEQYGPHGIRSFIHTVQYAKSVGLLVIADVKRGDGGDSVDAYANGYLSKVPFFGDDDPTKLKVKVSPMQVDAMTVHGYIGEACLRSFFAASAESGGGVFVVTKTSFKPNSEIEQLITQPAGEPVWKSLAKLVGKWSVGTEGSCGLSNVGVVMGATYPNDALEMREILPNHIFLVPGYGGQGASAEQAVSGIRSDGKGIIVNDSRRLIYAWAKGPYARDGKDFAYASRAQAIASRDELNRAVEIARNSSHV